MTEASRFISVRGSRNLDRLTSERLSQSSFSILGRVRARDSFFVLQTNCERRAALTRLTLRRGAFLNTRLVSRFGMLRDCLGNSRNCQNSFMTSSVAWLVAFCGEEYTTFASRRLSPQKVEQYRKRLAIFYRTSFEQNDPGIPTLAGRVAPRIALSDRFVLPHAIDHETVLSSDARSKPNPFDLVTN
jgi:hypothetical protein